MVVSVAASKLETQDLVSVVSVFLLVSLPFGTQTQNGG